jgi:hypothetical protein
MQLRSFPPFMGPKMSFLCLQWTDNGAYPVYSLMTYSCSINFNIILSSKCRSS